MLPVYHLETHRRVSLAFLSILISLALVSFGGLALAVEIDFAMWIVEPTEVEPTRAIIATYEALNPGVKVNLVHQGWAGYHDKLVVQSAAGTAPDVMAVSRLYLPSFAEANALLPLTDQISPLQGEIIELISGSYKGEIYGVPVWGGPALWMYNGTLFDEAGLPRPPKVYSSGDWTWDTAINMGKKITRDISGDGSTDIWALESPSTWVPDWVAKVRQFGGRVIDAGRTQAMIDQPEAVEALTLWADLDRVHRIAPSWGNRFGVEIGSGNLAIYGRYASESVSIARLYEGELDLGLVPQPAGPKGSFHIAGGVPLAVSATSKYPEEAAKFAVWYALYSDQWQLRGIPSSRSTLATEYLSMVGEHLENPEAIVHAMAGPYDMEPSVGNTDFVSVWDRFLHQVRMGRISPQEAAVQIASQINAMMAD